MTDSSRPKAATTTSQRPARLADKHDEAAVAPARPVAALLAVLTGCPLARFGLLPERFGMQLPGALRSLPSRLREVRTAQALQRLGRFLVQFLGAAVCCKLTRLREGGTHPCLRHPVRLVQCAVAPTPELAAQPEAATPT
jgi:hypothetical protein